MFNELNSHKIKEKETKNVFFLNKKNKEIKNSITRNSIIQTLSLLINLFDRRNLKRPSQGEVSPYIDQTNA